jgi:BON domain
MNDRLRELGWQAGMGLLRARRDDVAERVNRQLAKQAESLTRQVALLLDRASGVTDRLDAIQSDVSRRFAPPPPPKPNRGRTMLLLFAGVGAGYLAAYFLDPEQGRGRRAEVARRVGGMGLEANRIAQRTTMLATDKASGIKSRVLSRTGSAETDDLTLLDRVESEVFRDPAIPKGDINVMVVEGKAVLRGQVNEPQIGEIEAAVRKVVGVKDVENLLHVPGTPAPNKARSRAITGGNGGESPL